MSGNYGCPGLPGGRRSQYFQTQKKCQVQRKDFLVEENESSSRVWLLFI